MLNSKTGDTISYTDSQLHELLINTSILEVGTTYTLTSTTTNSIYGTLTAQRFVSTGIDQKYSLTASVNGTNQTYTFSNLPSTYSITIAISDSVNTNSGIYGKFIIAVLNAFGNEITDFYNDFHLYKNGLTTTIAAPITENQQVYLYGIDAKSGFNWSSYEDTTYNIALYDSGEYEIKQGSLSGVNSYTTFIIVLVCVAVLLILGIVIWYYYGRNPRQINELNSAMQY